RALYFDIYYAQQNYEREMAQQRGELFEFNEAFDKTGTIKFEDSLGSIVCTPRSCDVRLESNTISATSDDSVAGKLFRGIALGGSDSRSSRQVLGQDRNGPGIVCSRDEAFYKCSFHLFRKAESADTLTDTLAKNPDAEPGLEDCSKHDATVREAQAAQAELVDGGLLPLFSSADDRTTVGYLRYTSEDDSVL